MPLIFLSKGDIASLSSKYVYIGLMKGGDGNFYWVDGSRLTSPFWDKTQPQKRSSEDCGIFYGGANIPAKWHDATCDVKSGYICELAAMN